MGDLSSGGRGRALHGGLAQARPVSGAWYVRRRAAPGGRPAVTTAGGQSPPVGSFQCDSAPACRCGPGCSGGVQLRGGGGMPKRAGSVAFWLTVRSESSRFVAGSWRCNTSGIGAVCVPTRSVCDTGGVCPVMMGALAISWTRGARGVALLQGRRGWGLGRSSHGHRVDPPDQRAEPHRRGPAALCVNRGEGRMRVRGPHGGVIQTSLSYAVPKVLKSFQDRTFPFFVVL